MKGRLTKPLVRDGATCAPRPGTKRSTPAAGFATGRAADASTSFGIFSCSKATNEMNFLAQKFARR